jgi:hypothetical protein
VTSAAVGAGVATIDDALTQGIHIAADIQEEYNVEQTLTAAKYGAVVGGAAGGVVEVVSAARSVIATRQAAQVVKSESAALREVGENARGARALNDKINARAVGESNGGPRAKTPTSAMETQRTTSRLASRSGTPASVQSPATTTAVNSEAASLRQIGENARAARSLNERINARQTTADIRNATSNQLGTAGERVVSEATGLPKNAATIRSVNRTARFRKPDFMDEAQRYIAEAKNRGYQGLTKQLRDYKAWVLRGNGAGRVDVFVDSRTKISRNLLREHLDPGSPIKVVVVEMNK